MAKMTRTEKELMKAAGLDEYKSEDRKAQLKELCLAIQKNVDDDSFEDLSEDAQAWANAATEALEKKKPIADFGSVPAPEAEEPEEEASDDADDETEAVDGDGEMADDEEEEKKPAKKKTKPTAEKFTKKPATKPAEKKKLASNKGAAGGRGVKGNGYKGHRAGSCREQAHKLYDKYGAEKAFGMVQKLTTRNGGPPTDGTIRGWFGFFAKE